MDLRGVTGFDWDDGNLTKNEKHGVTPIEIEQIFMNLPLFVAEERLHSRQEGRFAALGASDEGRRLAVVFTLREGNTRIRPISARPMNRKERKVYEEAP